MTTKQLAILLGAAAVLGGAALCLSSGSKPSGAKLNGKAIFPKLDISQVARVELGDKLKLASGEKGWTVETYHNYPADHAKLTENLLKLTELKVGQVSRGKKIENADVLTLKDASGKEVASLPLGEKHAKWGHGRYATFEGETVLVSDSLDAFGTDGKSWVETKIVDTPWISFNDIAERGPRLRDRRRREGYDCRRHEPRRHDRQQGEGRQRPLLQARQLRLGLHRPRVFRRQTSSEASARGEEGRSKGRAEGRAKIRKGRAETGTGRAKA